MSPRRRAWWGLLILAAGAALLVMQLRARRARALRMDYCLRVQASCLGPSLGQEQALIDLLAKPRRGKADRAAALDLMRGLRDCWRFSGDLHASAPEEVFFVPLDQAVIWVGQSVQVGDDAMHLDPRRDAGILKMALDGLRGNLTEQRRNLLAFAGACKDLPWTPEQARDLDRWAQSLQPGR
ncbi:MAG TPA: hypothetical protein VK842_03630 [bacterium]|jgi:hypothetical protein|nr:hypothetical protein [bacterium]